MFCHWFPPFSFFLFVFYCISSVLSLVPSFLLSFFHFECLSSVLFLGSLLISLIERISYVLLPRDKNMRDLLDSVKAKAAEEQKDLKLQHDKAQRELKDQLALLQTKLERLGKELDQGISSF